ncbi:Pycsar system effector family protein [Thioclava sp. GXIMD4215]|uniref:Pycsar system effector family protein n=1 Tax=Thioclava sp. GXIMD4215 TaxID=3131928 RepID=UPI003246EA35
MTQKDKVTIREDVDRFMRYSDSEEAYIRHYIGLADTKATFLFSAYVIIIGGLLSDRKILRGIIDAESCITSAVIILALFLSITGAAISFWVVAPRLYTSSSKGFIFFNAISAFENSTHYTAEVMKLTDINVLREKLAHCYDTAKVCSKKYNRLRLAIWIFPIALLFAFFAKFWI